jgi:hypothetical protein
VRFLSKPYSFQLSLGDARCLSPVRKKNATRRSGLDREHWRGCSSTGCVSVFSSAKDGTQMRIGILGSTLMGSELDAIMARAGHDVVFSYSRSRKKLERLADAGAHAGTPAEAVSGADAVLVAVHWSAASAESVGNTSRAVEPAGSRWSTHACMLGPRRSSHSKSGGHQDSPDLLTLRIPRVTVNTSGATSATLAIAAVPPG